MKVRGKPLVYDEYGDKRCYRVGLFEDELRILSRVLTLFCDTPLFCSLRDDHWSDLQKKKFDDAKLQLTLALSRIDVGNVISSGYVVNDD